MYSLKKPLKSFSFSLSLCLLSSVNSLVFHFILFGVLLFCFFCLFVIVELVVVYFQLFLQFYMDTELVDDGDDDDDDDAMRYTHHFN